MLFKNSRIKFRAYIAHDSETGEMIEWNSEFFSDMSPVTGYGSDFPEDEERAILMQFIGLVDKNGKEIYEGDILDFDEDEWGGKFEPEVVPRMHDMISEKYGLSGSVADVADFRTVIGNVFENKDLITGENYDWN